MKRLLVLSVIVAGVLIAARFTLTGRTATVAPSRDPSSPVATTDPAQPGAAAATNGPWKEVAIECDKSSCHLKIVLEARERPGMGDLDSIYFDLARATKSKEAILTVEPLTAASSGEFDPIAKKIPVTDFFKKQTYEFVLPKQGKPLQFGIFLCKDQKGKGRCFEKPSMDLGRIMVVDAMHLRQDRSFQSPDLVYFFQYAVLTDGKLSILPGMAPEDINEQRFSERLEIVEKPFGEDERKIVRAELNAAKRLTQSIRSMPLELVGTDAHLVLPGSPRKGVPTSVVPPAASPR